MEGLEERACSSAFPDPPRLNLGYDPLRILSGNRPFPQVRKGMAVGVRELGYRRVPPDRSLQLFRGYSVFRGRTEWKVIDGSAANHHSDNPPAFRCSCRSLGKHFWINVLLIPGFIPGSSAIWVINKY